MHQSGQGFPAFKNVLGPATVFGFGTAAAVWVGWFVTHMPWVTLAEPVRLGVLLVIWLGVSLAGGLATGSSRGLKVGISSGLTASILGLFLLGTKIAPAQDAAVHINPILIALGFVLLGTMVGAMGGWIGGVLRPSGSVIDRWLPWFGVVAALTAMPVLFIGGLVTTRNVGLAVPDWPGTFGMVMFFYPLGNANEGVFLEHSHRLFGSLIGLTALVLMVWTWRADTRRAARVWATVVFAAVVAQGVLGGAGRVLLQSVPLALVHGILAQLIFAALVATAVVLWVTPARLASATGIDAIRRKKAFATAAMHSTVLQVILGAAYRHMRDQPGATHALWAHIGFSFIVLVMGLVGGLLAAGIPREQPGLPRALRRFGLAMVGVVCVQFVLGWLTWLLGGKAREPDMVAQALLRTAHQANGALLLGVTTGAAVLATLLYRHARRPSGNLAAAAAAEAPAAV